MDHPDPAIDKKIRILKAAVKLLKEQGIPGVSISKVARTAGVSDGAIYTYYANKDKLLESAIRLAGEEYQSAFNLLFPSTKERT